MGGTKNNKNGKQFTSDYQPTEKWTEPIAIDVAEKLIAWLKAEDENIFFDDFLFLVNDYHPRTIQYLKEKFPSFFYRIECAKKIQELKLQKFGAFDKLNASMTKFILINNHDWKDKTEVENTVKLNTDIIVDGKKITD